MDSDTSSTSCEGIARESRPKCPVVRFSEAQKACLTAFYQRGMTGCGKKHCVLIQKAAKGTQLTVGQVKVL